MNKNKYFKENDYIKVVLDKNISMLIDENDIDFLNKYNWKCTYGKIYKYAEAIKINENNKIKIRFEEELLNSKYINHINNNTLDNRRSNLEIVDYNKKIWKLKHLNRKKRIDNTSGTTGIYRGSYKNYFYWEVKGYDYRTQIDQSSNEL